MIPLSNTDCACQRTGQVPAPTSGQSYTTYLDDLLVGFSEVRDACPALKLVLIPDEGWSTFRESVQKQPNQAHICPTLFLAYKRATLHRLTAPIHRFVLNGSKVRQEVRKQYRKDLQELWMKASNEGKRHRRSKSFHGRIAELQAAHWLEREKDWKVRNLEMWGGGFDCTVLNPDGKHAEIEVKYFGQSDEAFRAGTLSLRGEAGLYSLCPYAAANFLLLRVCEAARQLESAKSLRIVLLIVSRLTWDDSVGYPLKNQWIDWQNPGFFEDSEDWKSFLERRNISQHDLDEHLGRLDRIHKISVLRQRDDFKFEVFADDLLRYRDS